MKTDNYLSLCLEQAAKSPLHYRHGCIVVRGGKVIGQGYNDYRPGFNGGALKHGRMAKGAFDGPAIAKLKEKLQKQKQKDKDGPSHQQQQQQQSDATFIPFEHSSGGGQYANTPLSMHSEMMAVYSALAASSNLSSTAFSFEKPCFKLPRDDKRKARLRREVLARYVATVCETSQRSGKTQVVHHSANNNNNVQYKEEECNALEDKEKKVDASRKHLDKSMAFQVPMGGEKHHHQKNLKNRKKNQNEKDRDQYEYQYDRHGQQIQQGGHQQQQSASALKQQNVAGNVIRGYEDDSKVHDTKLIASQSQCAAAADHGKLEKDYKRSGKMRNVRSELPSYPQPQPTLLPIGQNTSVVNDRKKHSRLMGADLYVARLGWKKHDATPNAKLVEVRASAGTSALALGGDDGSENGGTTAAPSLSLSCDSLACRSGSLHDELINTEPAPRPTQITQTSRTLDRRDVRASRPCYRCISYMHSVGIKRVFWTNDEGQWEGGKVRDLFDALNSSMDDVANGGTGDRGGPMGNGLFVTKHEVLMLKRLMGNGSG